MSRGKEVKELREKMGMNRREFSDYYGIPYRTVQDWEAEKRELPEYLLRLMKYRAEVEDIPSYTRTELTDALHKIFDFRTDNEFISKSDMRTLIKNTKQIKSK